MTITQLVLLLLAIFGLTFNLIYAEIFDMLKIRPLWERFEFTKKLFHCSLCLGFQIGWTYGLICYFLSDTFWFYVLTIPWAASGFSYFAERKVILIDESVMKITSERKDS